MAPYDVNGLGPGTVYAVGTEFRVSSQRYYRSEITHLGRKCRLHARKRFHVSVHTTSLQLIPHTCQAWVVGGICAGEGNFGRASRASAGYLNLGAANVPL